MGVGGEAEIWKSDENCFLLQKTKKTFFLAPLEKLLEKSISSPPLDKILPTLMHMSM